MAQEYKVTRVSSTPPKEWAGQNGTIYYIKCILDGHVKPVEIGKRQPDAIKVGDTVYGTITETQYEADKFRADRNPNGFGGNGGSRPMRDDTAIQAQFAIKAAIAIVTGNKE